MDAVLHFMLFACSYHSQENAAMLRLSKDKLLLENDYVLL